MIKTILVPTDYSENARKAAKYALDLAHRTGAKIIFFNSYYVPTYVTNIPIDPVAEENLKTDAMAMLDAFRKEHQSEEKNIATEFIVSAGNTVESIISTANEVKADIIVMGTKGAAGISEYMFGSNTNDVISRTKIPVLAIPQNAVYKGISNIVFATNYHFSDFEALNELAAIASVFDSTITIIHIGDGELKIGTEHELFDSFKATIKARISYPKLEFHLIEHKNIYEGLQSFIHQDKTDILSLSSRKKALYNRLFGNSITKKMAFHADVPLLIFKINEDDEITKF